MNETISVSAYPNPATDRITIESSSSELESLKIINIYGQEITDLVSIVNAGDSRIQIDLYNLKSGLYIINTRTKSTRIIKR